MFLFGFVPLYFLQGQTYSLCPGGSWFNPAVNHWHFWFDQNQTSQTLAVENKSTGQMKLQLEYFNI